jgi:deoxyribodipyrimidine photolyase-related protein
MGSYADGGFMSTKPYVSSGAYIHKMSNYCASCTYKVEMKTGEKACPFNILYWDYIDRHQDTFKQNPRMSMIVNVWKNMDPTVKETLLSEAKIKVKQHG